jgi:hypothetical protein
MKLYRVYVCNYIVNLQMSVCCGMRQWFGWNGIYVICVQLERYVCKMSLNFDVDLVPGVSYMFLLQYNNANFIIL